MMKNFTKLLKTLLLCLTLVMIGEGANAVTYYLTTTNGAYDPRNWNTNQSGGGTAAQNFTTANDIFIIPSSIIANFGDNQSSTTTFGSNVTLEVNGNIIIDAGQNKTTTLIINGIIVFKNATQTQVSLTGKGTTSFVLSDLATLKTINGNGIKGTNCSLPTTNVTLSTGANYDFNGSTQSTAGLPATVRNLTISGTGVKTLSGDITVTGTLNNSSSITAGSTTLTISGAFTNTGTFTRGTSTVVYNGTAGQNIAAFTYNNLTLSGTGAKTLSGDITVTGTLNNSSSITAGSTTLTISGAFTNTGTFTRGTSTVVYNGTAGQDIAAFTYNNLTLSGTGAKTLKGDATIGFNLDIASATFNTNNYALILQGNFTNSGNFNAGSSAITLSGVNTQNIAGFTTTGSVTVNKSAGAATLLGTSNFTNLTISSGNLTIPAGAQVTVSGETAITPANGLTIESDPETGAGTGSFITGSTSGAGTASMIRYMSPRRWHLVASPLSEQTIGDFLQANPSIPTNVAPEAPSSPLERGMRAYEVASNSWGSYFPENSAEKLTTGKGFSMRVKGTNGTQRVTFTGQLQPGTRTVNVIPSGWNCIGNPYTSAIGIKSGSGSTADFISVNEANLDPSFTAIYVWNQPNGDVDNVQAEGSYQTISNATLSSSTFPVSIDTKVQQGQAFMVKIRPLNEGETSLNVTFNSNMQLHQTNLALKSTEDIWPTIQLQATTNDINSSTTIAFHEGMTNGLDVSYDAGLLKADSPIDVYTRLVDDYGIPFAIQALPSDQYDQLVIPVGVDYVKGGQVSFSAKSMYLPSSCKPLLEDKLTGTLTDLTDHTYTADLTANTAGTGRFYLHTSYSSTGVVNHDNTPALSAWFNGNNEINITGNINNGAIASLYDLQGRLIGTYVMREGRSHRISLPAVNRGIYLLQVRDQQKIQALKVTIGQ